MHSDGEQGRMILVPWHIGDVGDVTENAIRTLRRVRHLLCEDADELRRQLAVFDIDASTKTLVTIPEQPELAVTEHCLATLEREDVALIASSGAPCFSDPGGWLVAAARARGFAVVVLAGASALTSVLSASGLDWLVDHRTLTFHKFRSNSADDLGRLLDTDAARFHPLSRRVRTPHSWSGETRSDVIAPR